MPNTKTSKKRAAKKLEKSREKRHKVHEINYDDIRNKLVNTKGRVRTHEENALIIQSLAYFQKQGQSLDASCKIIQEMFGGCHTNYHELWNYYLVMDALDIESTYGQRGIQPFKCHEINDFTDEDVDNILRFAFNYTVLNNTGFSIPDLMYHLKAEQGITIDAYTLQRLMIKFDFRWSQQPVYYGCQHVEGRKKELQRFLQQYSHALKLERDGSHVIFCSDESWSNIGTPFDNAWIHKCEFENPNDCYVCLKFIKWSDGNDAKAKISKSNTGKRVVFIHAFSKFGLLTTKNDNGQFVVQPFEQNENLEIQ